ncbi:hypothetical protein HGRIS_006134 [Hohenbuehelia grisea]|uniref:F-box domain-containing protein n=1 Tax=Hohenbuehelia grisea TaxID=104357 RepID=A0ABR3JZU4_9AGAR
MQNLPPEILLLIYSFLPLKSLIHARCVSQKWRQLVLTSNLTPARRGLLKLYYDFLASPAFDSSRQKLLKKLVPFDREAYINTLNASFNVRVNDPPHIRVPPEDLEDDPNATDDIEKDFAQLKHAHNLTFDYPSHLPDDFVTWVLEWPARAILSWAWPGLDAEFRMHSGGPARPYGSNCLSAEHMRKPQWFVCWLPLLEQRFNYDGGFDEEVPDASSNSLLKAGDVPFALALDIWNEGCAMVECIILHAVDKRFNGMVYAGYEGSIIPVSPCVAESWLGYQRRILVRLNERYEKQRNQDEDGSEDESSDNSDSSDS